MKASSVYICSLLIALSTNINAQVMDAIGDVPDPCIDIVESTISTSMGYMTAEIMVADYFCEKAKYQFHIDINGDGSSDFGYMAKVSNKGEITFHGSGEISASSELHQINFLIPISELVDADGFDANHATVWFRTHLNGEADLYPDKFTPPLGLDLTSDAATVVGTNGGEVQVDDPESPIFGTTITIPEGALLYPVGISLRYVEGTSVSRNDDKQITSRQPAFEILPSDISLVHPATISVPIPDLDLDGMVDGTLIPVRSGSVFVLDESGNRWSRNDAVVDSNKGHIRTETDHFSTWTTLYGRWEVGSTVMYRVENLPAGSDFENFKNELGQAFQYWSDSIDGNVLFAETSSPVETDLLIDAVNLCTAEYFNGQHCAEPTLLSASAETGQPEVLYFNTFIDQWVTGPYTSHAPASGDLPFLRLALHEIGHVMGLPDYYQPPYEFFNDSSNEIKAVMFKDAEEFNGILGLTALDLWDKNAVQDLYGYGACELEYPVPVTEFVPPAYREREGTHAARTIYELSVKNRHYYWLMFESLPDIPPFDWVCTGPDEWWIKGPTTSFWPVIHVNNWGQDYYNPHYCGVIWLTGAWFLERSLRLAHMDQYGEPIPTIATVELWDDFCGVGYTSNDITLN